MSTWGYISCLPDWQLLIFIIDINYCRAGNILHFLKTLPTRIKIEKKTIKLDNFQT